MHKALKSLDLALIMGGPRQQVPIDQLVARVAAQISDRPTVTMPAHNTSNHCSKSQVSGRQDSIPRVQLPSLDCFLHEYLLPRSPLIITHMMEHWPAMGAGGGSRQWANLEYIRRVAGKRTVPVEIGEHYMADGWGQTLMTLDDFVTKHIHDDTAVVNSSSKLV